MMEPTSIPVRSRDYRDEVAEQTAEGVLVDPEELFRNLYMCRDLKTDGAKTLIMGQVEMAKRRKARRWLSDSAYYGIIMFERKWVEDNIGRVGRKPRDCTPKERTSVQPTATRTSQITSINPSTDHTANSSDESPKRSWRAVQPPHEERVRRPQSKSPEAKRRREERGDKDSTHVKFRESSPYTADHRYAPSGSRSRDRTTYRAYSRPNRKNTTVGTQSTATTSFLDVRAPNTCYSRARENKRSYLESRDRTRDLTKTQSTSTKRWGDRDRLESRDRTRDLVKTQEFFSTSYMARERTSLTITVPGDGRPGADISGAPRQPKSSTSHRLRKRGRRKIYTCPMVGCSEETPRLKWHVLHSHAPGVFHEDLPADSDLSARRFSALSILAKAIHGSQAKISDLVDTVNRYSLLSEGEILDNQVKAMEEMCHALDWEIPTAFSLQPLNSPACLIHWKVLSALLQNLAPHVRESLRESFPAPKGIVNTQQDSIDPVLDQEMEDVEVEPVPSRLAFDSHFHLDRLQWSLRLPQGTSFKETMTTVGSVPEEQQIHLAGSTAVFCDVKFYPTSEEINPLSKDAISVAIGVHPAPPTLSEEEWMKFITTVGHPDVVGLGEIGLDYTSPYSDWLPQERQFRNLLQQALVKDVVVILHLRGMKSRSKTKIRNR
ncbi:MAG: TatD family hydrolase [Candidatus Thiodiazotropha endolucinida]|nr:TatD family hydrolase [Candidatus Thiodiazotropha endolucinida]